MNMQERIVHLGIQLQSVRMMLNDLGNAFHSASSIPSLASSIQVLTLLVARSAATDLKPIVDELKELSEGHGPTARAVLGFDRYNKLTNIGTHHTGGPAHERRIKNLYPPVYEKPVDAHALTDGLFAGGRVHQSKCGPKTLTFGEPEQDLRNLLLKWSSLRPFWYRSSSYVEAAPKNAQAWAEWEGTFTARLDPDERGFVVKIMYDNGCVVTSHFGVSRYTDSATFSIRGSDHPEYLALASYADITQQLGLQPIQVNCKVENELEGISYPGSSAFIDHQIVRNLLVDFLRINGYDPMARNVPTGFNSPQWLYTYAEMHLPDDPLSGSKYVVSSPQVFLDSMERGIFDYREYDKIRLYTIAAGVEAGSHGAGRAIVIQEAIKCHGNSEFRIALVTDDEKREARFYIWYPMSRDWVTTDPAGYHFLFEKLRLRYTYIVEEQKRERENAKGASDD